MHHVAAIRVDRGLGALDGGAGHFRDLLHQVINRVGLAVRAAILVETQHLVARRHVGRRFGHRAGALLHEAEGELGGFRGVGEQLGVVLGIEAGELHLDAVGANRADDRLGDAHAVDAVADDVDGLRKLLLALVGVGGTRFRRRRLEGEGDAALEVEAELERALRLLVEVGQQDVVPLLNILERTLELDVREELREVDPLLATELPERDVEADFRAAGLAFGDAGAGLRHQFGEIGGLGRGFGAEVVAEGLVLQRQEGEDRPQHQGGGQDYFPEVTTEHGYLVVKGGGGRAGAGAGGGRDAQLASAFLTTEVTKPFASSTLALLSPMRTTKRSSFTLVMIP